MTASRKLGIVDVFSEVIATVRTGQAKFTRTRRTGAWGNRFGPYPGAGFHVLLHGSCWLTPPAGEPIPLHGGDVVFLPHGSVHGMSDRPDRGIDALPPEPPGESDEGPGNPTAIRAHLLCGAYRLHRGQAHPFLRTLPDVVHLRASSGHHDLRAAVDLLGAELANPRPGTHSALPARMDLLLVFLLRAWLDEESTRRPDRGWPAALTDPMLAAALNHIHTDPARRWTVRDLGAEIGMSKTAFARKFAAMVGQPPMTYLTWWRLSSAARLLRDTDAPLTAIATQVGYASEFGFANAFRREFGVAPGRFRRDSRSAGSDEHQRPAVNAV
ncbi:AraC family transcriptional regulator [Nocardia sp. NPDC051787]|uniref:AraC family transcriptional regulator n=1 Tax=Nocardia sp. NPDC051787 TaxID=3155415 RepID=UPI003437D737